MKSFSCKTLAKAPNPQTGEVSAGASNQIAMRSFCGLFGGVYFDARPRGSLWGELVPKLHFRS